MRLIVHIDDILTLAGSRKLAREHVIGLIYLLENLGFVISKPKCVLEPTQSVEFIRFSACGKKEEPGVLPWLPLAVCPEAGTTSGCDLIVLQKVPSFGPDLFHLPRWKAQFLLNW